jgi:hypothetical protein
MRAMIDKRKVPDLLFELCVDLGYCLPPRVQQKIESNPPSTINAFADAVFIGEGMDKSRYPKKWLPVRERVAKYFA